MAKRNLFISILSSIFILLWIYAAGVKLINYNLFRVQLFRQPLPIWSVSVLTWALPMVELGVAVMLCFQRTRKLGLMGSFVLMSSFTLYVGLALGHLFGKMPCACGGIFGMLKWRGHLVLNIVFTIMAVIGVYLYGSLKRIS